MSTVPGPTTYAPNLSAKLRKAGFQVHSGAMHSALRVKAVHRGQAQITVDYPEALRQIVLDDLRSQLLEWGYAVSDHAHLGDPYTVVVAK